MTHRVVFTPSGKRGEFAEGASVLEAARALGVDLDSVSYTHLTLPTILRV